MTTTASLLAHSLTPVLTATEQSGDSGMPLWIVLVVFAVLGIGVGVAVVLATSTKRKGPASEESATAEAEAAMLARDTTPSQDIPADAPEGETPRQADAAGDDDQPRQP